MSFQHNPLQTMAWLTAAGAACLLVCGMLGAQAARLDAFAAFRWHAASLLFLALLAIIWPARTIAIGLASPLIILGVPIFLSQRSAPASALASFESETRISISNTDKRAGKTTGQTGTKRSLRLVTFNTWDEARNIDAVRDLLRQSDADVAVLVEVSPPKRAMLEVLKPLYPHQVHCAAFWPCSMALVSRLPFEAHGTVLPSLTMPAAVWGRIAGEGGGLTIIGVHVHRPTRSPRIHLGHMHGVAELSRKVQFPRAGESALVVAGDFNTPDWAASMRWLQQQTGLRPMGRTLPTWPAWPVTVPQFPIDHILVSGDATLENVRTGPASGSDHLPVLGTIVLTRPLFIQSQLPQHPLDPADK